MTDFFERARRLELAGRPFATATVVRVDRPTSGRPGDRAIVTLEGELFGWIGGSCARPTVIDEALAALRDDRSRLIRLSTEPDAQAAREGLTDLAMTCFSGGTMEIFVEPHQPRTRIVVLGDQPVGRALTKLAEAMDFEVARELEGHRIHPLTFVVVATHGDSDEIALEQALASSATYVGLVSSPKRAASIRKYLSVRGLDPDALERLHAPAGLDIQARSPEEIALSILAEIVQVRRNLERIEWQGATGGETETPGAGEPSIDPVCGMSVRAAAAQASHEHDGRRYYFCCVGCREKFAADPQAYL